MPATVTVPLAALLGVIVPGPVHAKVAPPVEEEAETVGDGTVQLIVCAAPAVTFGRGFTVTVDTAVLVQPNTFPVTV